MILPVFRLLAHTPRVVNDAAGWGVGWALAAIKRPRGRDRLEAPATPPPCSARRSVGQLARNQARIRRRALTGAEVCRAVASYFVMFAQTATLPRISDEELSRAVIWDDEGGLVQRAAQDTGCVIAVTHSGNWDLAGRGVAHRFGSLITVAEVVKPPALFHYFVRLREALGMQILPAQRGIYRDLRDLVAQARRVGQPPVVALLADRDISGTGVEVSLSGHRALVAAGPAALAHDLDLPLFVGHITRRRYRWRGIPRLGVTLHVRSVQRRGSVPETTQAWVEALEPLLRDGVEDWHMMQPLFVDDLDLARLQRARARAVREADAQREQGSEP